MKPVISPQDRLLTCADEPAHVSMPGVHRISALLKRWLMGTHQGAVKQKQLDYYLDEFTFRFNRRNIAHAVWDWVAIRQRGQCCIGCVAP